MLFNNLTNRSNRFVLDIEQLLRGVGRTSYKFRDVNTQNRPIDARRNEALTLSSVNSGELLLTSVSI